MKQRTLMTNRARKALRTLSKRDRREFDKAVTRLLQTYPNYWQITGVRKLARFSFADTTYYRCKPKPASDIRLIFSVDNQTLVIHDILKKNGKSLDRWTP